MDFELPVHSCIPSAKSEDTRGGRELGACAFRDSGFLSPWEHIDVESLVLLTLYLSALKCLSALCV